MKKILITGAGGMIGGLILQKCLASDEVAEVRSIVRKPTGVKHPKLREIVHHDFCDYTSISTEFRNIDVAYYCIGVYTGAVPRDEFRKITVDYTMAFGEALRQHSDNTTLCFLSGQGADRNEKSSIAFAKDKGIAENILVNLGFKKLYIFRPAYIYPSQRRKEPNLTYKIMRAIYPLLKVVYPAGVITSNDLATSMFAAGMNGYENMTLENREIRHSVGLY
jgi:nucleoside-diphosphate-sugar epimerase